MELAGVVILSICLFVPYLQDIAKSRGTFLQCFPLEKHEIKIWLNELRTLRSLFNERQFMVLTKLVPRINTANKLSYNVAHFSFLKFVARPFFSPSSV